VDIECYCSRLFTIFGKIRFCADNWTSVAERLALQIQTVMSIYTDGALKCGFTIIQTEKPNRAVQGGVLLIGTTGNDDEKWRRSDILYRSNRVLAVVSCCTPLICFEVYSASVSCTGTILCQIYLHQLRPVAPSSHFLKSH
jgi:hypothetical protein